MKAKITSIGSCTPTPILTNADFERMVDTSDEWITSRTGIKERRICSEGQNQSDLCVEAAQNALTNAGLQPEDIDFLIVATVSPDYRLPSASCIIQKKLGLVNAATFDIVAACAGFLYGLSVANAFIKSGQYKRMMVIGAEHLSSLTDYTDRNTCVLFGDGAGAAILEPSEDDSGILSTYMKSDGRHAELLWIPDGGSKNQIKDLDLKTAEVYIKMNGKEVFKHAVRMMADSAKRVIAEAGMTADDVNLMIPHQANMRIIQATAKRLDVPMEKVFVNIEKYGNTSAASVPLALDEAIQEGRLKKGDIILMSSFGGGLTWSSVLARW